MTDYKKQHHDRFLPDDDFLDNEKNYFKIDLDYDLNELIKIASSDYWQVFNQNNNRVEELLELRIDYGYNFVKDISFLDKIPFDFHKSNVFFMKILPHTEPIIHRDLNRSCALNIAVSESARIEPINFYDKHHNLTEEVLYDAPTVVNVNNYHAVTNSTDNDRILFSISLYQPIDELEKIYDKFRTP
tara:strand:- start:654 stop:1214 length:561 start_codon:yes stop_codon:yes gene_type:complete